MMKANAIFGIKATSNWKGKVYNANTKECYDGINYTNINACFRAYNSLQESISDYFDLICGLSRYASAIHTSSPRDCITAIKNGGYATSPTYIDTIMSIINSNNLTKYDTVENVNNSVDNSDIEKLAREVIEGKYGNGEERRQKLGSLYNEVQKRVNQISENTNNQTNELKTLARNTNLRDKPTTENSIATLYLANTTLYVIEKSVANANGYTWDKVRIRVNGKEGYMINCNYK